MPRNAELTPKQQAFAEAYARNGQNGTRAAIEAGYAEKGAHTEAYRLLRNADVRKLIDAELQARRDSAEMLRAKIEAELLAIATADLRDVAEWAGDTLTLIDSTALTDDAARALREVVATTSQTEHGTTNRLHVKQHDKLKALQLLAKMNGLVQERVEHSGNVGLTLAMLAELTGDADTDA